MRDGTGGRGAAMVSMRHAPPDLPGGLVVRARLVDALRGRFERRLTVLHAGAGFGKTTVLAQAVAENLLERQGLDAWLRVGRADQDPTHLCAGLAQSVAGTGAVHAVEVDDVVERVWSAAPEEVAVVVDDVHLLGEAERSWQVLRDLLDRMPANGHLVLAGRAAPLVPMARLLAADDVLLLDEEALAFTPAELAAFADARALDPALTVQLPPWPALAALTSTVGHGASATFLWEEVLGALPPHRSRLLALAAQFDVVDDVLVEALAPGAGWTAGALIEGLPLVQSDGRGAYRLHALLADAVRDRVAAADRADALARAGRALLAAGAERRAAEAAALAGDDDTLRRAVCRFATRPINAVSVPDVVGLYERLPAHLRTAPVGLLLDAARHWGAGSREAMHRFDTVRVRAREVRDAEVEAIATWRLLQLRYLDRHDDIAADPAHDRLAATGVPLARSVPAFVRSVVAHRAGRVDEAIAALDGLDDTDPEQRRASVTVRMLDLGRPEAVPADVESLLRPGAVDLFAAMSVWIRGDATPEEAWAIGATFPGVAGRKGVLHDQASMHAIVAIVATAAGELAEAQRVLERARAVRDLVGRQVQALVSVAEAVVALTVDGEAAAVEHLRAAIDAVPVEPVPGRAHLCALAPLRALLPDDTVALDHADLGPALTLTVAAGRAIVALRRRSDAGPAASLPWLTPNVLRCLVPPPLLTELALAAADAGAPGALDVLDRVPDGRRWLQRLADRDASRLGRVAGARLALLPARPPYDIEVATLGRFDVVRTDGVPVEPARMQRERVRQLLAHLVLRRRIGRAELAAAMWPTLDAAKAADNLRVNLRHLQAALQPDRGEEPPWFVQATGDAIALSTEGVVLDVDAFDDHVRKAAEAEAAGMPSLALAEHRSALALYGGDLLPGLDLPFVDVERVRLGSLALASRCRVGELVLARGEPEAAMHEAVAAMRLEPLSERAHRLFVRCHLAVGSTDAARTVGRRLLDDLAAAGVPPEAETVALLRRLGLATARSRSTA